MIENVIIDACRFLILFIHDAGHDKPIGFSKVVKLLEGTPSAFGVERPIRHANTVRAFLRERANDSPCALWRHFIGEANRRRSDLHMQGRATMLIHNGVGIRRQITDLFKFPSILLANVDSYSVVPIGRHLHDLAIVQNPIRRIVKSRFLHQVLFAFEKLR